MWGEEALENYACGFYVCDRDIDHLGAGVPSSPFFLFVNLMTFESSRNTTHEYIFSIKSLRIADKAESPSDPPHPVLFLFGGNKGREFDESNFPDLSEYISYLSKIP